MSNPDCLLFSKKWPTWQCAICGYMAPALSRSGAEAAFEAHDYWTHGEGKK